MATSPRRATLFANVALLLATVSSTATGQTASNTLRGSTVRREDTDIAHSNVVGRKLSMERCLQDEIIAERSQIGLECICKSKADQGIVMVCSDQCAFCNDDQSVCGIKSTETLYDSDNGSRVGIGLVFEYLKPGSAMLDRMAPDLINMAHVVTEKENSEQVESPVVVLGIEEVDCEEDEESQQLTSCDTCNVYLGGKPCESCDLIECGEEGSGVFAPVMDCTNVQPDSEFNFCEEVQMDLGNPFQAFLTRQFEKCLPMDVLIPGSEIVTSGLTARPRTKATVGSENEHGLVST